MQSVTLSLFRFGPLSARLWAFAQMGLARGAYVPREGNRHRKLCGSGTGEGFTPIPNTAVYAILATWPDHDTARRAFFGADVFRRYSARTGRGTADDLFLTPCSVAGPMGRDRALCPRCRRHARRPARRADPRQYPAGPRIAVLGQVPTITQAIGATPTCSSRSASARCRCCSRSPFSIWPDTETMAAFRPRPTAPMPRRSRPCARQLVVREELYARFRVWAHWAPGKAGPRPASPD
jgi:spheroidene monooxygenase